MTGWGKSSIQWYKDDKIIQNANGLKTVTKAEGIYYVNIIKGRGSYNTYKIVVKYNVNFIPLIVSSSNGDVLQTERTICKNEGYTIFNFRGYDRNFHANSEIKQWYKDGVAIESSNQNRLKATDAEIYQLKVKQSGTYQVEAYQNGCYAASNEMNLGVIIALTSTICNGDYLTLKSTGESLQSYAWTGPNNFKSNLQNVAVSKTSKKNQGQFVAQVQFLELPILKF